MTDSNSAQSLRKLIESVFVQEISVGTFCEHFERVYNFELEVAGLTATERSVFEELFNKVVYYSPFPEERQKIPNYLSEKDILDGVRKARDELNQE